MFTGIVEDLGEVLAVDHLADSARLTIATSVVTEDLGHGDSVSVNGVCLTVTDFSGDRFAVDVMAETLHRSSIAALSIGSPVNLERALRSDGRFGGHVVQGHVDATTTLLSRQRGQGWDVLTFALDPAIARYVVSKGSITLDGVSLTISDLSEGDPADETTPTATFSVSLIPTTLRSTTLGRLRVGDAVNVEVDVLAKYVERLMAVKGQ